MLVRPITISVRTSLLLLVLVIHLGVFGWQQSDPQHSVVKNLNSLSSRRSWIASGLGSIGAFLSSNVVSAISPSLATEAYLPGETRPDAGRFFFPAITPPFRDRATYRYKLGRDMWAFEQLLTFSNVTATIRSNVVRLGDDLWVSSPLYPTGELCALLDELPGTVRHIVLSCNAFEHKAALKNFVQRYPGATVWIAPGQYGLLGGDLSRASFVDGVLDEDTLSHPQPPWRNEIDFKVLYIDIPGNAGPVSEVAFYHHAQRTLITTDAVVYIPNALPESNIFQTYFDTSTVSDATFWPRTVLQAVFLPLRQNEDGSFPGFERLSNRLVRAPILRGFNDARGATETRKWISEITGGDWDFDRIVTAHFSSPISARPDDLKGAFGYLFDEADNNEKGTDPVACQDWELLDTLNEAISQYNLGAPATFDYKRGCVEAYR